MASVTLRLTWLIQAASGSDVMPAISTRRVDSSMRKNTANRVRPRPVQTSSAPSATGRVDPNGQAPTAPPERRTLLVLVAKGWREWRTALIVVQPETVLR